MQAGGTIDRTRTLRFQFAGRTYHGHPGDTLASALLANGVRLVGRSFKYHRPRGIIAAGVEEPNALVQLGTGARSTPNVRATEVALYDGLVAAPVNCWPNVGFDIGGINDRLARFLAAGFYYKTFMWPNWRWYEGLIRRAAGLGRAPTAPDPDRYESRSAHCDVLVIGAGPAGLAAARAASRAGRRVMLVEQDATVGGTLRDQDASIDGMAGDVWAADVRAELEAAAETRVLTKTVATSYFDYNALMLVQTVSNETRCIADQRAARYRLWQVRASEVVLATGGLERPLVFAGNDRPGVMLAGATRAYAKRWGVRAGERAFVFTNNDDAYDAADVLLAAGSTIAAIVDLRESPPVDLAMAWRARGVEVLGAAAVIGTSGRKRLRSARVRMADGREKTYACDLLAMSGGINPAVHLFSQSGGTLRFDEDIAAFVPDHSAQAERSVGAAAGRFALAQALADGHAAGGGIGIAPLVRTERLPAPLAPMWHVAGRGKAFVDFQNDVSADDIALSARENFRSVEHLKRYTTLGMAPDQGKTSNVNALAILARLTGRGIGETGTTRFRPPFTPVPLGLMAGRARGDLHRARREMPGHDRHVAAGAVFEDYGGWLRPAYYPRAGESAHDAEQREAGAVRARAGLFEGSPLGKVEVKGPDAALFLDRIYANTMSTLKAGRVRYGLMLSELGIVIDDGVAARLAEDHFLVCTSSGGADRIAAWMEEWRQCEWPELDLVIAPVTTAWGVLTLSGPAARDILMRIGSDIDLTREAFPHMSLRAGMIGGVAARVLRVSYTGDLSYEINVPPSALPALWDRIVAGGAVPVGIDAWMVLRTEKGYLHIGADTDGTTTPLDIGWQHVLRKKGDFIGKRSLRLAAASTADRLQFVGLDSLDGVPLPIGAHVLASSGSDGYVTSTALSPALGRPVALGMLRGGRGRSGERVTVRTAEGDRFARVVSPAAFDPDGARLDA